MDPAGNPLFLDRTEARVSWSYDPNRHLIAEETPLTGLVSWTYDPAGRRVTQIDGSGSTDYGYDAADELLTVIGPGGVTTNTYDPDGARTKTESPGGVTTWTWDAVERLVGIELPDGSRITSTYRHDGLRVTREDAGAQQLLYDGSQVHSDSSGARTRA